jgi:hypothetical protein
MSIYKAYGVRNMPSAYITECLLRYVPLDYNINRHSDPEDNVPGYNIEHDRMRSYFLEGDIRARNEQTIPGVITEIRIFGGELEEWQNMPTWYRCPHNDRELQGGMVKIIHNSALTYMYVNMMGQAYFSANMADLEHQREVDQSLSSAHVDEQEGRTLIGKLVVKDPRVLEHELQGCFGACGVCKIPNRNNQLVRIKCEGSTSGCGHVFCRGCIKSYFRDHPQNPKNCFMCSCPIDYFVSIPDTPEWQEKLKTIYGPHYDEDIEEYKELAFGRKRGQSSTLNSVNLNIKYLKGLR